MRALVVSDVKKEIAGKEIVKGVSFEVDEGEIFGIIGPNGVGKTTLLRMIATLLKVDGGKIEVFGFDVSRDGEKVRRMISYLPEEAGAYKNLRGIEYLRFMGSFFPGDLDEMVKRAAEISGLGEKLNDKISTYSKGMTRRLLIARALMNEPKLAILDEPTSGLDVLNAKKVRDVIKEFARRGTTFVISSHNMLEVEYVCDRVALMSDGRIIDIGTPGELKAKYSAENLEEVFTEAISHVEDV